MELTHAAPALDDELDTLRAGAARWVAMHPSAKARLLDACKATTHAVAPQWARLASDAKGITGSPVAGEEWLSGPWALLYALNRYVETLDAIALQGKPSIDDRAIVTRGDRLAVRVFPQSLYDRLLLAGIRAEVWMQAGVSRDNLRESMATWYADRQPRPRVTLVLGAGNIAAIAPLDVLYKLVADGSVCMLKLNPVNAYLHDVLEHALEPLIAVDALRIVEGSAEIGQRLCNDARIDEIHVTGSEATHDAIVFGSDERAPERKRDDRPLLDKPITSELGNVTPTIVVPGDWSDADFTFQAEQIVTQKMHNAGFNCIASQVLVLPTQWSGTAKLIDRVRHVMETLVDRPAYYPGASERISAAREAATFDAYGETGRTLVFVDARGAAPLFTREVFGPVLAVTTIDAAMPHYLDDAVHFANERLWGTLAANLVVHPATVRSAQMEMDRAIRNLRYGCVAINAWAGVGFLLAQATWGAYPGNVRNAIGSGKGVVHNTLLFERAEKSVIYAPFSPFPKPPWFVTNRAADRIGRALVDYEFQPSPLRALRVAVQALRG